MSLIIFIVLLALLILVHELGHFLAAKSVGARVDEFAIGFPPRLYAWKPQGSETTYSINWIPFGGFVKIFGENGAEDEEGEQDVTRSLAHKSRLQQAWVLAAGVIFNVIFAWLVIGVGFMVGFPTVISPTTEGVVGTPEVTILEVGPNSPAEEAGLQAGDVIVGFDDDAQIDTQTAMLTVEGVQSYVNENTGQNINLTYEREGERYDISLTPEEGIVPGRGAIGVALQLVGIVRLPFYKAFTESATTTWGLLDATTRGLWHLLVSAVHGDADLSQVSGPVGIIGLVGDAASRGFMTLLSFAAVISLNLAIINLVPFPALDGGRLLFIVIEAIIRRPLPSKMTLVANGIGFMLLILLMLIITVNDVVRLFS